MIHTRRGATGLEAPNHQSHRRMQLLVALPCPVLQTKDSGDGFQFFEVFAATFQVAVLKKANYQQKSVAWHVVPQL